MNIELTQKIISRLDKNWDKKTYLLSQHMYAQKRAELAFKHHFHIDPINYTINLKAKDVAMVRMYNEVKKIYNFYKIGLFGDPHFPIDLKKILSMEEAV